MLPVTEILQTAVGHSREILFIRQEGRRNRERERERESTHTKGKREGTRRSQDTNKQVMLQEAIIAPENGLSCRVEHIDSLYQYCPNV